MEKSKATENQKKRKQSKNREEVIAARSFRQWRALYRKWMARDKRRYTSS